jgi:hypothetical protein
MQAVPGDGGNAGNTSGGVNAGGTGGVSNRGEIIGVVEVGDSGCGVGMGICI